MTLLTSARSGTLRKNQVQKCGFSPVFAPYKLAHQLIFVHWSTADCTAISTSVPADELAYVESPNQMLVALLFQLLQRCSSSTMYHDHGSKIMLVGC